MKWWSCLKDISRFFSFSFFYLNYKHTQIKWKQEKEEDKSTARFTNVTSDMYEGPSSSTQRNSGRSGCSVAERWDDLICDGGSSWSHIPSTPCFPWMDPAWASPRTQAPAHSPGAVEGLGTDSLEASGSGETQMLLWGQQPWWSQALPRNEVHLWRCCHEAPHQGFQLVPALGRLLHAACTDPRGPQRYPG